MDPKRELPWPEESDPANVGAQFADPNAADDRRVGKNFEETNSSRRRKETPPLGERIHWPENRRPLYWFLFAFFLLVVIVVLAGWLPRHARDKEIDARAKRERDARPVVEAAKVLASTSEAGLAEPGTTIPLTQAYVYARANGYLKKRLVDIGDHVRQGQLLAVIDAPDLDAQVVQARQQVMQAERQLDQQRSQLALATVTVQRYRVLVAKGVFSRQDGDTQEANYASSVANVQAAQRNVDAYKANLEHQIALQSYEQVRAPFAGVITERDVDVGALISAAGATSGMENSPAPQGQISAAGGTSQAGQTNNSGASGGVNSAATSAQSPGQGGPLFGIEQMQRLRILVSVPEEYATAVHVGMKAPLSVGEYEGPPLYAEVTGTADSIDPNTRTMLTELQIDNSKGKLIPGMYVVVTFPPAPGVKAPLLINGDAIAIRNNASVVATVVDGKVKFVPVTIGRDFGGETEILTGLKAGDVIVTDVTDDVVEGARVKVHLSKPAAQKTAPPPQTAPLGGSSQYSNEGITDQNLQGQQMKANQKSSGKKPNTAQKNSSESKP
ncbi:MAG: efflux RND transporter periplasmic adaptor subunit [Acidobacteriaceae bacterium]